MWLYAMDETITPPEFFIKILQHYEMYEPAFLNEREYSFKRPFIQAMVNIMMPWEQETSERNSIAALSRQVHTLGVTPVAVPDDTDVLSEDPLDEDDWSDHPEEEHATVLVILGTENPRRKNVKRLQAFPKAHIVKPKIELLREEVMRSRPPSPKPSQRKRQRREQPEPP